MKKEKTTKPEKDQKKKYEKPQIESEKLTAVAAVCNGATGGGRKSTTGAPSFCSASKLKS